MQKINIYCCMITSASEHYDDSCWQQTAAIKRHTWCLLLSKTQLLVVLERKQQCLIKLTISHESGQWSSLQLIGWWCPLKFDQADVILWQKMALIIVQTPWSSVPPLLTNPICTTSHLMTEGFKSKNFCQFKQNIYDFSG